MSNISVNYTCVYELKFAPEYKWTKCGKCFNIKRGKELKQVYNSGCVGYNIRSKFYSLTYLRTELTKIRKIKLPF